MTSTCARLNVITWSDENRRNADTIGDGERERTKRAPLGPLDDADDGLAIRTDVRVGGALLARQSPDCLGTTVDGVQVRLERNASDVLHLVEHDLVRCPAKASAVDLRGDPPRSLCRELHQRRETVRVGSEIEEPSVL